jgi:hypothetical protein
VAELVDAGGWEAFREAESVALAEVAMFSGQVVSCGGGIVLREENRARLCGGIVLYLKASPEALAERLLRNPLEAQRPSLTGGGVAERRAGARGARAVYSPAPMRCSGEAPWTTCWTRPWPRWRASAATRPLLPGGAESRSMAARPRP